MHTFLRLLLAVTLLLYSAWVPAASLHSCCAEHDCPVTQCAAMGCAQAQFAPMLAGTPPPTLPAVSAGAVWSRPVVARAAPVAEIWTPPD